MENSELNGKLVYFKATDGLELQGFISESKQHNKKIIIHIHGMQGDFVRIPLHWELAKQLKGSDFDFFPINTRGSGLKTRFYKKSKKMYLGTGFENFEESYYDIEGAIKETEKLGYKQIILSGHSTGCQKIIYYQSKRQNKKVKGLILLGAGDDYNLAKKQHGKKFDSTVKLAKKLVAKKKGFEVKPEFGEFCAKRYLSFADTKNPESKIVDYFGKLELFSKIKEPMLAIFGTQDNAVIDTPKESLKKLRGRTKSDFFITAQINGAKHSFMGKEKETCKVIQTFLKQIR
ncbi:MAG: alpha/beta fold hydrolase [archaeon]